MYIACNNLNSTRDCLDYFLIHDRIFSRMKMCFNLRKVFFTHVKTTRTVILNKCRTGIPSCIYWIWAKIPAFFFDDNLESLCQVCCKCMNWMYGQKERSVNVTMCIDVMNIVCIRTWSRVHFWFEWIMHRANTYFCYTNVTIGFLGQFVSLTWYVLRHV